MFLVKLLNKNSSSINLLLYSHFWNLVDHWQILRTWNNFLIFSRWRTIHTNIGLTSLDRLKTCITLSLSLLKLLVKRCYLSISCDEVSTIHNQFWCNVHVYVVDGFKMMPLSLNLERVIDGSNVNNLT
jgi:hypothetical protein